MAMYRYWYAYMAVTAADGLNTSIIADESVIRLASANHSCHGMANDSRPEHGSRLPACKKLYSCTL